MSISNKTEVESTCKDTTPVSLACHSENTKTRYQQTITCESKGRLVPLEREFESHLDESEQHKFVVNDDQKICYIRIPSDHDNFIVETALEKADSAENENKDPRKKLKGKLAIYVTVGSIKSWVILEKSEATDIQEQSKEKKNERKPLLKKGSSRDQTNVHSDGNTSLEYSPLLNHTFTTKKEAEIFMKELKTDEKHRGKYRDKHLEAAEVDDPAIQCRVVESLVCLFRHAIDKHAALVIPDYTTASPNSRLIEEALNYVDFHGPVLSVSCDDQVLATINVYNEV